MDFGKRMPGPRETIRISFDAISELSLDALNRHLNTLGGLYLILWTAAPQCWEAQCISC